MDLVTGYEVEKSQKLPPPSWRTRNAGGIIESKSEVMRTRKSDFQGQEKMDVLAKEE